MVCGLRTGSRIVAPAKLDQTSRMSPPDFEITVSVKLLHPDREATIFSAILERDPHFLHWNRMSLVGNDDDYRRFLPISRGQLEWELYDNPDWPYRRGDPSENRTSGVAILTRTGRAGGISIAHDGIQKFAELAIHRHVETYTATGGKLSALYAFLQRPPTWYANPRRLTGTLSMRGEWRNVTPLGLKLRLLTTGHRRSDSRISKEVELIEIPGFEVQPIADMSPEAFVTAAEDLWFSIRILLMYRFRQPITPLTEQIYTLDKITTTWHRVEVELRQEARNFDSVDFLGRVDDFLARAAPRLATCREHSGLLHAATWGYAASFGTMVLEAQLTDRVEAIERLVAVHEKTSGLDRDRVNRKKWKPIKSALKGAVDQLGIDAELAGNLKRGFASSPPLTLQERIERMAALYCDQWNKDDRDLLKGLGSMITARNDIVHGRLVDNIDHLAVERLRAQVIFEKLFMSFVDCPEFHSSGYAQLSISSLERRLAGHDDG
jgi:hypothetical protein